jgi:hypothetical protein
MRIVLLAVLLAGLCIVSGLLAGGIRRWWLVSSADYYAARLCALAGFGTAWVLFLANRVTVTLCSARVARDCARNCWQDVRSGEVTAVELHRELVGSFREAFEDAGLDDSVADRLVELIEREAIRREQERLFLYVEPERSAEILDRIADALDEAPLAPLG